jgi:hypothetical protein
MQFTIQTCDNKNQSRRIEKMMLNNINLQKYVATSSLIFMLPIQIYAQNPSADHCPEPSQIKISYDKKSGFIATPPKGWSLVGAPFLTGKSPLQFLRAYGHATEDTQRSSVYLKSKVIQCLYQTNNLIDDQMIIIAKENPNRFSYILVNSENDNSFNYWHFNNMTDNFLECSPNNLNEYLKCGFDLISTASE